MQNVTSCAADAESFPKGNLDTFREAIEHHLSILGLSTDNVIADLFVATQNFRRNRELDERSSTAGHLKRRLLDLAALSGHRVERHLAALEDFERAPFFGLMPGSAVELSIDGSADNARLLPNDGSLLGSAFKTLTRLGDNELAPTGLVYRRRTYGIADQLPFDASVNDLSSFLTGLARIVAESATSAEQRDRRIRSIAERLLVAGSLGCAIIYSALSDRFSGGAIDEQIVLLEEITPLCLQEVQSPGGEARTLGTLIFHEFVEQAPASDQKQILILFAKSFPNALLEFARVLAEQIDTQYRVAASPRSSRRDARRWHEAHAGWKLIDEVLDAVWPSSRREPRKDERNAIFDIVQQIMAFADEGVPRRPHRGGEKEPVRERKNPGRKRLIGEVRERDGVPNAGNFMVNQDHVETLIGLRAGIGKLDVVLGMLDRKALFELEPKSRTEPAAARELDDLRRSIAALQLWRRELAHKRERGEYERVKLTEPRAVGTRVTLPRMPQVKGETLAQNDAAVQKIIAAAQVLRPA